MTTTETSCAEGLTVGDVTVLPLLHPQGCRTYLVADRVSGQAMAIDVHLDYVNDVAEHVTRAGWSLTYVVDTHTHADHPSGSAALAGRFSSTRIAHQKSQHQGVSRHPEDDEALHLGDVVVTVRHAPGHTQDHIMLLVDGGVFSGDTLLINGVARTDFLGGDAGQLFDSLHAVLDNLPDDTVILPGHDYQRRVSTTLRDQRRDNAWFQMKDRDEFVRQLTANPPPQPANMDDLLRLNREAVDIPSSVPASEAARRVAAGGWGSVIDVRTGIEFDGEHVEGSRSIPLDQVVARADEIRATPAPRLLLCRGGNRAEKARQALATEHIAGLSVVEGGIEAFRKAGGATKFGSAVMSLERQVRIAAGSLVLAGVLLGTFLHPALFGLAAFVGAGLVFAGITDWCGMGLLLAKAPWNRGRSAGCAPAAACAASQPTSGCAASPPKR